MKVIGFVGSPRKGGNTETLVAEVLRGAGSVGAETERISLAKAKVTPCRACDRCREGGRCRVEDEMQPLYDKLFEADVIVLGTPVYFWGPSAQAKAFVDRWYAIDQEGIREKLAGKRFLLVCAFADSNLETASPTISMMRTGTEYLGMEFQEPLLGAGCWEKGDAAGKAGLIKHAFETGAKLGR
jgi:multimeric flavodoxin WrbA